MKKRLLTKIIVEERKSYKKMIFVSGPRQVGKTTLFRELCRIHYGPILNWDNLKTRALITKTPYAPFEETGAVYFDEIHKYPRWKNYLKGAFDTYENRCLIYVTGSSKLDVYRRGGDSMLGRYRLFRLHPFTLNEFINNKYSLDILKTLDNIYNSKPSSKEQLEIWALLNKFGGFPEPLIAGSEKLYNNWKQTRHERLVREDIRDTTRIRELALLEQLITLLPDRIGNPLSLNSLKNDLGVSHDSIRNWISTLEEFYYLYMIPVYTAKYNRSLQKERKPYLWDWSEVEDPGFRFENMIASHLLKWCHLMRDTGSANLSLSYMRDKEKNEVDFIILDGKKPMFLVEAKKSDTNISKPLLIFSKRLGNIPVFQVVDLPDILTIRNIEGIKACTVSATRFIKALA